MNKVKEPRLVKSENDIISMINTIQSFHYDELDSTQDEAKRLIQSGKIKDIAYVVSSSQTNGRGTRGRKWSSPAGSGIYLSVIHLPKKDECFETTTLYTQACGIACVEAIKEVTNIETKLKPVNDIYFNDKKLGGILVESRLEKKGISYLISGVGININKTNHKLDRDVIEPISLEEIMNEHDFKCFLKEKLIEKIIEKIYFWYEVIFKGKKDSIQKEWKKNLKVYSLAPNLPPAPPYS